MKKLVIVSVSIVCILLFIGFVAYLWTTNITYRAKIYPNIAIEGVPVSKLSLEEATEKVAKRYPSKKNVMLVFTYQGDSVATVSAQNLAYTLPIAETVKTAQTIGRDPHESFMQHLLTRTLLFTNMRRYSLSITPHYNKTAVGKQIAQLADAYHVDPIDARFEFKDNRVTAFTHEQTGMQLDTSMIQATITDFLSSPATKVVTNDTHFVALKTKQLMPKLKLKDSNNFGIVELVASGSSQFVGSSPERIHNVVTGASRLNGIIIKKGETFSFVTALGDISSATGFKPAYIIRNGKTVLDDGGGICQVSTTMFRAALNGGLPIIERHAHAYRVGYYEQDMPPGFDATIYSPTVDLKFQNTYPSALLIQTEADPDMQTLRISFYGTKDDRHVSVGKATISNQAAAPPAEYIDDPTLPNGVVKQVDFSAPGARSTFTYDVVQKGRESIHQTFISDYRPWKAIFMRGTLQ